MSGHDASLMKAVHTQPSASLELETQHLNLPLHACENKCAPVPNKSQFKVSLCPEQLLLQVKKLHDIHISSTRQSLFFSLSQVKQLTNYFSRKLENPIRHSRHMFY